MKRDGRPRLGPAFLVLAWVLLGAQAMRLAVHKAFSIDEFQYAHAAWLVSRGQVPYRDFFEVHLPLLYQVLAPVFQVLGDDPLNVLALRGAMLVPLAGTCVAVAALNRREGRTASLLAPVLLLSLAPFVRFATEIRPDALATALMAGALALLSAARGSVEHRSDRAMAARSFTAGALLVAAVWGSQKVLFHGGVVGAALMMDLVARRGRVPALVPAPRAFLVGAASVLTLVVAYLTVTASWGAWWHWCFAWASEHQRHYPGFSWSKYFEPVRDEHLAYLSLAVLGCVATLRRWWSAGPSRWSDPDLLLCLWLLATFGSYALQRAPFPYSLLPFLAALAPFAARGAVLLLGVLKAPGARMAGAVGLAALVAAQAWRTEALLEGDGNARQREVLARIATLTGPEDVVYDNSGGYVSRPHAHFYFYTDAYLRGSIAGLLSTEMPEALVSSGCVLRVDDLRTSGLPPALRRFLDENYQPLDGDLFLWGRRYEVPEGGALESRFLAVREGRYFVSPEEAREQGTLWVDGERIMGPDFALTRGEHTVRYEGAATRFFVLWLPRDGRRWTPKLDLPPTFSRLF